MWNKISQIWKIKDLRNNILFVFGLLVVFRLAAHIPIPGVDLEALKRLFQSNQFLGLINIFSGGSMQNFSVVAMGVGPYITASIIFQLLIMIVPALERLSQEGEHGRHKINQYTRWLSIPLAALQGYSMLSLLRQSGQGVVGALSPWQTIMTVVTLTAGTVFLMWLGELISEKKIGNGVSILIFVGIVTAIPGAIGRTLSVFDTTQVFNLLIFAVLAVVTVIGVVILTEGQRNVPVSYAKRVRGIRMFGGVDTYLPLRVNMGGVIPIIFAISIILVPPMVAQFMMRAQSAWLISAGEAIIRVFNNQLIYGLAYFFLVVVFTYFYTFVIFHPQQIADNLQKQGGFIPGIRPGATTATYLNKVVSRIILGGALFLGIIAVLPLTVRYLTGMQTLAIGGTSLLIVVSVVIEIVKQVESQLTMRDYEGF
ncbi:MAG: preprotein translocase subunit SecY [Patescibacteria group bacterium]|jgi:preprotein translocase subunit SecY